VYVYDPETKQQSSQWKIANFTVAEKSALSSQQCQVHVDRFFDIHGIVHKEFVPPGRTVNGKFYCEVLKGLREGIRCKRPDKWNKNNWFLHHDNAPAHTSLVVRQFLTSKKHYSDSPHPNPYSPDHAPCDFFLIPKKKLRLKERHFDTTDEIHTETQEVIDTLIFENFHGCTKSWETRSDRCIHALGDYTSMETVGTRSYGKELLFMVAYPELLGSPKHISWQAATERYTRAIEDGTLQDN